MRQAEDWLLLVESIELCGEQTLLASRFDEGPISSCTMPAPMSLVAQ